MAVKKYTGKVTIDIDEDKCTASGECVDVCPGDVYEIIGGKSHAVRPDDCVECCNCVENCPTGAIVHSSC